MNEPENDELLSALQTLKGQRRPWRFVYLAQGPDGEPFLTVRKQIPSSRIMEIRSTAKNKTQYTTGWIVPAEDRRSFRFHPEVEPPPRFRRDLLQGALGKLSRLLKTSEILETGSQPAEAGEVDVEGARHDSRERTREASELKQQASRKQSELQQRLTRVVDLDRRLGDATLGKKNAEDDFDRREQAVAKALSEVEALQGKWFKGKAKKAAAEKLRSARAKLEETRRELLDLTLGKELAFAQLKDLHQLLDASESAVVAAESAQATAARARAVAAEAEAVQAEGAAKGKRRALDRAVRERMEQDPELRSAMGAAADADALATQAVSVALAATDEVAKLEKKLDEAGDGEREALERALATAQEELDAALRRAQELGDAAARAQDEKRTAIEKAAGASGPLRDALDAGRQADAALAEAVEREELANTAADEAEDAAERNAAMRRPRFVIEGLPKADFERVVAFLSFGDPQIRVDFDRLRIGIAHDALVFGQQNRYALAELDKLPPMKGRPEPKQAARFAAAWGSDAYKDDLQRRKDEAKRRGEELAKGFDWDERDRALAGKADALDLALAGQDGPTTVATLLDGDTPGALFGESHSDPKTQNFLYDNFDAFVANGVDTFYIEHISVELQPLVDAWLASDVDTMPAPLQKALYAIQVKKEEYPRNLVGLLEKAKKQGLSIRGIDTTAAKGDLDPTCDSDKSERVRRMNALAGDVITGDPKRRGKFVALTGAAHNTAHVGSPEPVPGIGDILGVVPVALDDSGAVKADREDASIRNP
jgi:hypothetical protein